MESFDFARIAFDGDGRNIDFDLAWKLRARFEFWPGKSDYFSAADKPGGVCGRDGFSCHPASFSDRMARCGIGHRAGGPWSYAIGYGYPW